MTSIFEQPWLLLAVSAVVFLAVVVFRAVLPQKHKFWFWLFPVIIAASAFAFDYFVQTDVEKIKDTIAAIVKAAEKEDAEAIAPLVSNDYRDSFHQSKRELLENCRQRLAEPIIEKNVLGIVSMEVKPPKATVVFTVRVVFDPKGPVFEFRKMMLFKLQAQLAKEGDKWLLTRIEVVAIDLQPADWRHIQGAGGGLD